MDKNSKIAKLDENIDANYFFMNDIMHCFNSNARKTASYKYAFFKSILDNLFNANLETDGYYYLPFSYLSFTFSKIYWNLSSKHNIPLIQNGKKSLMVEEYNSLKDNPKYKVEGVDFDVLNDEVKEIYLKNTKSLITKDVLYALYSDFNGRIYGYDKDKKFIYFSKNSYEFLINYKDVLEKIDYYAWIKWTENILDLAHSSISNLSRKLDEAPERKALDKFKKELLDKGDEYVCFYCGKPLLYEKMHLDHFIPWSFVKDNQPWNFVFACSHCNESKNDRIPDKKYLHKLFKRNEKLFAKSYEDNLNKSYDAALHNGFVKWDKK